MTQGVGLSVGATRFAGVQPGHVAVTRRSVLTLYRHRPPELGVPAENPNVDEPGVVVSGFTERVGDPVGIVAGDGAIHRGEVLVADALRALLYTVTNGAPVREPPAVTYPAHWPASAVHALRRALAALPEWSGSITLVPDAVAAIAALQSQHGMPARGVIAVCDFGGSGTSITLLDAADRYRPTGPTVRHTDFSGDLIDQALMTHVLADVTAGGAVDVTGTSALSALTRLRAECRGAKERLSRVTVTALHVDVPGFRGDVRLTREELDGEIREPLAGVIGVVQDTLVRDGIHAADLAAVVSIGGGASIPAITTGLSQHLRVPVLTMPRPELTAAEGAALRASRESIDQGATMAAPVIAMSSVDREDTGPQSITMRALAWSEAHDVPPVVPVSDSYEDAPAVALASARPQLSFTENDSRASVDRPPWYRRSSALLGVVTAAFTLLATSAIVALGSNVPPEATNSQVGPSTVPAAPAPDTAAPPDVGNPPPIPTRTVVVAPAPAPQRVPAPQPAAAEPAAQPAPPRRRHRRPRHRRRRNPPHHRRRRPKRRRPASPAPPPTTTPPPPADPPSTEPPPPTNQPPPSTQQPLPFIPRIPIPNIPGITSPLIPQQSR